MFPETDYGNLNDIYHTKLTKKGDLNIMVRKKISYKIKGSKGDRAFDAFNYILMTIILIASAYPLVIVISSAFSDPYALMSGKVWLLPKGFNLEGFKAIFNYDKVWRGVFNSFGYTILGTLVNMIMSVCMAYPLSRNDFTLKGPLSLVFAFTMWFSGGLIPTYLLVRDLGMFDTIWSMIFPGALSVWYAIIIRTNFQSNAGGELLESAKIDGCSDIKYLISIAIPLVKPALAVIFLYYAVGHWNAYMIPYLYIRKQELQPLQIVLRDILLAGSVEDISPSSTSAVNAQIMNELLKYSLVVFATLPVAILYPFVQKFFVKGIMVGAIKG